MRVLSEPLEEATSVSLGVWIRAGSRDERDEVAGISHLMEHMLFKGTPDMDALGIAQAFESIGAQENAATGEEYTVLYARFLPEHLERALDIMSDMVLRPTLVDLEREREVIVEEIRMYEDRPDQLADEFLSGLIFHDDPLGRPIIGSAETVRGVDHDTLKTFHHGAYTAPNVFVVAAGKLDRDELERMVEEKFSGLPEGQPFTREARPRPPGEPLLLQAQGDGAIPRLAGIPGDTGPQRGPLRDGGSEQRARRRHEQPALPGGSGEARARLRSVLLPPGLL